MLVRVNAPMFGARNIVFHWGGAFSFFFYFYSETRFSFSSFFWNSLIKYE